MTPARKKLREDGWALGRKAAPEGCQWRPIGSAPNALPPWHALVSAPSKHGNYRAFVVREVRANPRFGVARTPAACQVVLQSFLPG